MLLRPSYPSPVLAETQPKAAPDATSVRQAMRIGLLSQWYQPEPQTVPEVLARELMRRQHMVKVLTGFPNYPLGRIFDGYSLTWRKDELVSGVDVRRVALFPSHSHSRVGRLLNYATFAASASLWGTGWFRDIEALWVFNSPPTVGLPTWITKARYRPRVVMHIMDLWPESLTVSGFGRSMLKWHWLHQGMDRWLSMTYEVADLIACTSRNQVELLNQRGIPRDKLSYAPIWIDETVFHPVPKDEALAVELGVADKTVLLYAGSLGEAQGLDVLVDACNRLSDVSSFHCVVAGSGIAEGLLREQAAKSNVKNISFLRRWPMHDMTRLMSIGDIHFVSLRADPLSEIAMPSKLPATLACARPVIVAARGDASNIVSRSGSGWTCEPGDAEQLERAIRLALTASKNDLLDIGQRARRAYEAEFALTIGVERIESLLRGGVHNTDVA